MLCTRCSPFGERCCGVAAVKFAAQVMFAVRQVKFAAQVKFALRQDEDLRNIIKKTGVKGVKKQVMAKKAQVI